MSETVTDAPATGTCESPPPAAMPAQDLAGDEEPRRRLAQLAAELVRSHNRRLVVEYLRLRRAVR